MCDGTTTNSAKAPARWYSEQETPKTWRESQRLTSPRRQKLHAPQEIVESNVTLSPSDRPVTPLPTAATFPAASCPMTIGGMRRPDEPSRSEEHTSELQSLAYLV